MSWLLLSCACTIEPHVPTPPQRDTGAPSTDTDTDPVGPVEDTGEPSRDTAVLGTQDSDGDGVAAGLDCDDHDPSIHPGATEFVADGVDQDCDGWEFCYRDVDADGFGTQPTPSDDLTCLEGLVSPVPGDCDDQDASVHPGAVEIAGDGVDQDCDGQP